MGYSPWGHKEVDMTELLTHSGGHLSPLLVSSISHAHCSFLFAWENVST